MLVSHLFTLHAQADQEAQAISDAGQTEEQRLLLEPELTRALRTQYDLEDDIRDTRATYLSSIGRKLRLALAGASLNGEQEDPHWRMVTSALGDIEAMAGALMADVRLLAAPILPTATEAVA